MANISVIIPCYNVAAYIDRCLTSVTQQAMAVDTLEIICIDDASTDDTWQHLQKWEQAYPQNVMIIHSEVNGRQGTARNIGLQYASAPWVAFIDADDWIEPDYFSKMYDITLQGECDIVCCEGERDFSTELTYLENRSCAKDNRFMIIDTVEKRKIFLAMQSMGLYAWGKLIRKNLLINNQIFFPENLAYEDCYWGPLLHMYAERIYFIEEKLYHYFVNINSTVLQKNAVYHTDCITVQTIKWHEAEQRGFLENYRDELEYDFLRTCYLGFLKILFLRYDTPSFSLYQLVKEITLEHVPDYRQNPYLENGLTPFYATLLESLVLSMNRDEFLQLADYAKTYWNESHQFPKGDS